MKEQKKDLRVIKTKRAICSTVCRLLSEKDIDSITISEVAEQACVNRKTFYNYYGSVYEVVDEISMDIVNGLESLMESINPNELVSNPSIFFSKFREAAEPSQEILGYLMKMQGNQSLAYHLIEMLKERFTASLHSSLGVESKEKTDIIMNFILYGTILSYREWFNQGQTVSLDVFSGTISKLVSGGLDSFAAAR